MSKENLTPEQLLDIKELDKHVKSIFELKEKFKEYKLNDICILERWYGNDDKDVHVDKTHTGFPHKYKCVFISSQGIPFFRKLTSAGNPTGQVLFPPEIKILKVMRHAFQNTFNANLSANERFAPDPEQMDSILLQQEFDPMAQHREKSKLYNEIAKHNKKVTIPTGYLCHQKIADFFKSRKPGDKFWTSVDKQYVIQSVAKIGREWRIKATDMNQDTVIFNISSFQWKRLYKEQPRSYGRESKA